MWGFDKQDLIQILVLVLIFGVGIIQFIYRTFVKPIVDAEAQKRQPGGGGAEPGKALRDFLAELRGEPPKPRGESPKEAGPERAPPRPAWEGDRSARDAPEPAGEELLWEEVEERRQVRRPAQDPRPQAGERRSKRGVQRGPRQPLRKDRAARESRQGVRKVADDDRDESGPSSDSGQPKGRRTRKPPAFLDSAIPQAAILAARSKRIPRLGGMGLREALLAQVILGPPRARQPRRGALGWRQSV